MTKQEDFLKKLNPKIANSLQNGGDIEIEYLKTPSLGINKEIGGVAYGRFMVLWGNKGSGKSTFAMGLVAEAQKNNKSVVWMDVEKNFSPDWARQQGADPDKIMVNNTTISIAGMADKAKEYILAGVDVLVIDSISQLLPQSFFEDPKSVEDGAEITDFAKTGQIGTYAKNMGAAVNILNGVNKNTLIILISQVRNKIGSYGAALSYMGGQALEHTASTVIKFWRSPSDVINEEVQLSDSIIVKKPVGTEITWTINKNRGPGMDSSNKYNLITYGDYVGVDSVSEVVTYGIEYGKIKKSGNWLTIGEDRVNGKASAIKYLRENKEEYDRLYEEIKNV